MENVQRGRHYAKKTIQNRTRTGLFVLSLALHQTGQSNNQVEDSLVVDVDAGSWYASAAKGRFPTTAESLGNPSEVGRESTFVTVLMEFRRNTRRRSRIVTIQTPKTRQKVEELLLPQVHHEFYYGKDVAEKLSLGCDGEIDDMLRIRLREAGSDEEMFTLVAWIRAFNINEPIYAEFCHEFYSTYEFDEVYADDELQSKKIIKFRLGGRAYNLTLLEFAQRLGLYQVVELEEEGFNVYFEGGLRNDDNFNTQDYWLSISREDNLDTKIWVIAKWMKRKGAGTQKESQICYGQFISKLARKCRVLTEDVVRSLSAPIYCRDLDTITLKDLIDSEGKLIPEDPQPGMPRVGIPRPPRASMQDLYDRMGRMEIRQDTIERMEYRQSYHWDSTISSTSLRHHRNNSRMMTSSVEMTRVGYVTAWDHEKEEKAREKLAQRKDSEYRSQLKTFETHQDAEPIADKIKMLDHSKAEPMGILRDVLCQVGVTIILARFLILDIPMDKDVPIVVGEDFFILVEEL
ncbi:hypothetical protein Tco_0003938 [Tanacetum coccineum]